MEARFDADLVDEICAAVVSEITDPAGDWRTAIEHGNLSVDYRAPDAPPLQGRAQSSDADTNAGESGGMYVLRTVSDYPGVHAGFVSRRILARSRAKVRILVEFNEFVSRERLVEEIASGGLDPSGLGFTGVYKNDDAYFGWTLQSYMLYTNRRLPDGSAIALKLPVALVDGAWSLAGYKRKLKPLTAWHVVGTPGGCRLTFFLFTAAYLWNFLPQYMNLQIQSRILAKYTLRITKTVYAEFAEETAPSSHAPESRPLPFASGSASFALRRGGPAAPPPLGLALDEESPYPLARSLPFIVHSYRLPGAARGPPGGAEAEEGGDGPAGRPGGAPDVPIHDLFFDLLGIDKRQQTQAQPPGAAPAVPQQETQVSRLAVGEILQPALLSRVGEAMRASLDLSLQLESMSLSDAYPPSPQPAPACPRPREPDPVAAPEPAPAALPAAQPRGPAIAHPAPLSSNVDAVPAAARFGTPDAVPAPVPSPISVARAPVVPRGTLTREAPPPPYAAPGPGERVPVPLNRRRRNAPSACEPGSSGSSGGEERERGPSFADGGGAPEERRKRPHVPGAGELLRGVERQPAQA
eukprot:tig00000405_g484.t1